MSCQLRPKKVKNAFFWLFIRKNINFSYANKAEKCQIEPKSVKKMSMQIEPKIVKNAFFWLFLLQFCFALSNITKKCQKNAYPNNTKNCQ